jgi:hypothetical protein
MCLLAIPQIIVPSGQLYNVQVYYQLVEFWMCISCHIASVNSVPQNSVLSATQYFISQCAVKLRFQISVLQAQIARAFI